MTAAINTLLVITAWAAVALLVAAGIAMIAEEFVYGSRRHPESTEERP